MNIITGYKGEPHITSLQDRAANQGSYGTGSYVLDVGSKMTASVASANEIHINDGVLSHQGCVAIIEPGTYDAVEINNGQQGMNRIDRIVARYKKNSETNIESLELAVIEGTPTASTPSAPSYSTGDIQNGALQVDMPLYNVRLSGITIASVDKQFSSVRTQAEMDTLIGNTSISGIGGGTVTGAISALNGNVRQYLTKTVEKAASTVNYISSGIDARLYHVLSVYEQPPNGIGASCNLGCNGSNITAYLYSADGTPYTGAAAVTFIYVAK